MIKRLLVGLCLLVLIAATGWLGYDWYHDHKQLTATPATKTPTNQNQPTAVSYSFVTPSGWQPLTASYLGQSGAKSGIGVGAGPVASFLVRVSDAVPTNADDQKQSVLSELQQ